MHASHLPSQNPTNFWIRKKRRKKANKNGISDLVDDAAVEMDYFLKVIAGGVLSSSFSNSLLL